MNIQEAKDRWDELNNKIRKVIKERIRTIVTISIIGCKTEAIIEVEDGWDYQEVLACLNQWGYKYGGSERKDGVLYIKFYGWA